MLCVTCTDVMWDLQCQRGSLDAVLQCGRCAGVTQGECGNAAGPVQKGLAWLCAQQPALALLTPFQITPTLFHWEVNQAVPSEAPLKIVGNCCRNSHRTCFIWGFPALSSLAQAVPAGAPGLWAAEAVWQQLLCTELYPPKRAPSGAGQLGS